MARKPIIQRIGDKLTAAERDNILGELSEARLEHTRLKLEKRDEDRTYNEQLNVLDDKIQLLAESARDNKKYQDVEVRLDPDDAKYQMATYRVDNGKLVGTRPMDEDEREEADQRKRQPNLPFESAGLKDAKAHAKSLKKTIFEQEVKVGPRDATPAPDRIEHGGQSLTKVKRGAKKTAKKSKGKEARP